MSNGAKISYQGAARLVQTLFKGGVRNFVYSPGFRNSPIVLALLRLKSREPSVKVISHIDERGAAFVALGLAKPNALPAAVICTSGTALANYLPAVEEAYHSGLPLVVISADRPNSLQGIGANQTMAQANYFGASSLYFAEIDGSTESAHAHLAYHAAKAVSLARGTSYGRSGPVHLNINFSEPFLPHPSEMDSIVEGNEAEPDMEFINALPVIPRDSLDKIRKVWSPAKRVLVLIGPGETIGESERIALKKISRQANTFILAEASSGFNATEGNVATRVEPVIRWLTKGGNLPDLLVRIGAPLISKSLADFEKVFKNRPAFIFDGEKGRNSNLSSASHFTGGKKEWLLALADATEAQNADAKWINEIKEIAKEFSTVTEEKISNCTELTEIYLAHRISGILKRDEAIFIGNSMPIRDFNLAASSNDFIKCYSNRGLSGIDGLLSTAIGVSLAENGTTYAILGDLSTIHDLNALSLAKRMEKNLNLHILVINNNGGEIFRAVRTNVWKQYEEDFATPQELDFKSIAQGFGIRYTAVKSKEDLDKWFCEPRALGLHFVEVFVDSAAGRKLRESIAK